ncbi:MAG: hypothetical protein AB1592_14760 [Pseudomonadota bacterium]
MPLTSPIRTACPVLVCAAAMILACGVAAAQSPAEPLAVSCPPSLNVTYSGIAQLPFPGKELDIGGFTPAYSPTSVRLIGAEITPPADAKNARLSGVADNEMTAKPGETLIFTIWPKGQAAPAFPAVVSCAYEGGYALQRRLPATVRTCSLTYAASKTDSEDTSTREIFTKAEFLCR